MKKCWHCKNQFEFWKIRILIPDKFEENSPNFMKFGWVTKKLWLTIFVKSSVLDVWQCSEYASEFSCRRSLAWWGTYIPNTHEKSTKNQNVTEWCRCDKCRAMDKNVECLHCHQVEAVEYFEIWIAFFCGMVDRRKTFGLNSSRDHRQRSSPSRSPTRREQDLNLCITWVQTLSNEVVQ